MQVKGQLSASTCHRTVKEKSPATARRDRSVCNDQALTQVNDCFAPKARLA
jgi:hypothetical protein